MTVTPHHIVVLALDGVITFELGIPARIFAMAEDADGAPLYRVTTCGLTAGPVQTTSDFDVHVRHDATKLAEADTVVIPASHEISTAHLDGRLPAEIAAAFAHIRPGTRVVSICTASFLLAAAGLLDGRPATTHWMSTEQLQRLYPKVKVDPDVLYTDDGDVLTSAGVSAGIDLCLHIVRRDHGTEIANKVARRSVIPPWRDGGQAQYIERPVPGPGTASTAATRAWILDHLTETLALTELASHANMSVRTFTRRFRDEVGRTPGRWITAQRVERARGLLESTDLSADQIARRAGFGTSASLRKHLHEALGVAPMTYRRTFRGDGVRPPAAGN
ncbi:GlxA family transcriptional regulator [Phytomonospora endophytica]|uniref:Transcriptional regulator GlxA family with amidase domain n=1 Tax=Phytomonospora endophytica TaxID=714109 RepID=A0A841FB43_9ACTN|nr:helix-turn-helix domain-containing protein [Phytomonospora endophytica]MBB6033476.1 transcriptional regulator GlxA family with amidase domain [Phytomonospora endophytica]